MLWRTYVKYKIYMLGIPVTGYIFAIWHDICIMLISLNKCLNSIPNCFYCEITKSSVY